MVQHVSVSAPRLPPFVCVNSVEPNARFVLPTLPRCHLPKKCVKNIPFFALRCHPIHFSLLEPAFRASGYKIEVLPNDNKQAVDVGLKYVNNDACYPSLMVVGQIMEAILSGKYDTDKIAVIIS